MGKKKRKGAQTPTTAMVLGSSGGIMAAPAAATRLPQLKEEPQDMMWEQGTVFAFRKWCTQQIAGIYAKHGLDENGNTVPDDKGKPKPHDKHKAREEIKSFATKLLAGGYVGRRTFQGGDITHHLAKAALTNAVVIFADHL